MSKSLRSKEEAKARRDLQNEGRCSITLLLVRWLKRQAEEARLAPGDAWGMLTTGRKNRLFRVHLFQAPAWFREVSAKLKRLPTSSEVLGIPTRKIRTGGWQLTLFRTTEMLCWESADSFDTWKKIIMKKIYIHIYKIKCNKIKLDI